MTRDTWDVVTLAGWIAIVFSFVSMAASLRAIARAVQKIADAPASWTDWDDDDDEDDDGEAWKRTPPPMREGRT